MQKRLYLKKLVHAILSLALIASLLTPTVAFANDNAYAGDSSAASGNTSSASSNAAPENTAIPADAGEMAATGADANSETNGDVKNPAASAFKSATAISTEENDDTSADTESTEDSDQLTAKDYKLYDGKSFSTLNEAVSAGIAAAKPNDASAYENDEIIVIFKKSRTLSEMKNSIIGRLLAKSNISKLDNDDISVSVFSATNLGEEIAVVALPEDVTVEDALLVAANDPNVKFAQPNYVYHLLENEANDNSAADAASGSGAGSDEADLGSDSSDGSNDGSNDGSDNAGALNPLSVNPLYTPNDPKVTDNSQWWLNNINAISAWDIKRTEQAVTVGILDTGVRLTHKDLQPNLARDSAGNILAWDAVYRKPLQTAVNDGLRPNNGDADGHGTHVAGLVAARAGNGILGAGASYNAKILPVAVFSNNGGSNTARCSNAMDYLMSKKVETNLRVINMSLGGYGAENSNDQVLHGKITAAKNMGIVTVAAGGNGNPPNPAGSGPIVYTDYSIPSDWPEVTSVVAVESDNSHSWYSDYNQYKDISAPGTDIYSTWHNSDSGFKDSSGTSMAAPIVSGVFALLFAAAPGLSADQAQQIIYNSATDLGPAGRDDKFGYGLINARAALQALPPQITITANSATKTYDGNPLVANAYSISSGSLLAGHHIASVNVSGSQTKVGSSTNVASNAKIFDSSNNDVTANYLVYYAKGTLKVVSDPAFSGKLVTFTSALNSAKTLDVPARSLNGGTQLNLWQTNYCANQRFVMEYDNDGYYAIKNINSGLYLDIPAGNAFAGAKVIQWSGNNGNNQKWALLSNGNAGGGTYTLVSKLNSNYCINISGGSSANGASIILWPIEGHNNERFNINTISPTISDGIRNIKSASSGKLFDIKGGSTAQGAQTIIWPANGGDNQKFNFIYDAATGYYTIKCVKSGLLLDVNAGSSAPGARVIQWPANGGFNQKWVVLSGSSQGSWFIYSANSGLALDVNGGSTADGAMVITWDFHGKANQQWQLS
ncbi:MAG: RICIN domain-containing protein [Coriobacteriales bacterium]|jgi:subtilisin family serine protease|nr:RICIN domain-containing protein [Coriobacteriales bacterium]